MKLTATQAGRTGKADPDNYPIALFEIKLEHLYISKQRVYSTLRSVGSNFIVRRLRLDERPIRRETYQTRDLSDADSHDSIYPRWILYAHIAGAEN